MDLKQKKPLIVCPGVHSAALTRGFVDWLQSIGQVPLVFPADREPAYSAAHLLRFLHEHLTTHNSVATTPPLVLIGFSAGVVAAVGAAQGWQMLGGRVRALIALDGWGVPLWGDFAIHRVSHDAFTHQTSAWLGAGEDRFYADPAVPHLDLWRSPQQVHGWHVSEAARTPSTAAAFMAALIEEYAGFSEDRA